MGKRDKVSWPSSRENLSRNLGSPSHLEWTDKGNQSCFVNKASADWDREHLLLASKPQGLVLVETGVDTQIPQKCSKKSPAESGIQQELMREVVQRTALARAQPRCCQYRIPSRKDQSVSGFHLLDKWSTSIYFHICNGTRGSSYGNNENLVSEERIWL